MMRPRKPVTEPLYCALCFYVPLTKRKIAKRAVTIVDGTAVCGKHMGIMAANQSFTMATRTLRGGF